MGMLSSVNWSASRRAFLAIGLGFLSTGAAAARCVEDEVSLRGDWGSARFSVEVVDDPEERARGLMFRETLAQTAGMLFVYERPQRVAFWMRNTLIPLDMLFLDDKGVVRHIHHRAVPGDETPIDGGGVRLAVLEINGGLAEAMGIDEGTVMRHPAFGPDAAWPCE